MVNHGQEVWVRRVAASDAFETCTKFHGTLTQRGSQYEIHHHVPLGDRAGWFVKVGGHVEPSWAVDDQLVWAFV